MVSATVQTVAENAKRLLKDAELLFANERYGSATSLGILSIEEAGKACLVRWKEEGIITRSIKSDLRQFHFHKQRVYGCFVAAREMLLALADFTEQFPEALKPEIEDINIENTKERVQRTWRQFILAAANNGACLEFMAKRAYNSSSKFTFYAEAGIMDSFKQLGFYVDVDKNMIVHAQFGLHDHESAEEVIALARMAIEIPFKNVALQKVIAVLYERGPQFGTPKAFAAARASAQSTSS